MKSTVRPSGSATRHAPRRSESGNGAPPERRANSLAAGSGWAKELNLISWNDYTGVDPETSLIGAITPVPGINYFNNPQTRSWVFTIAHRLLIDDIDLPAARNLWARIWPLCQFLESVSYPAAIKAGAELAGLVPTGPVRAPLVALDEPARDELAALVEQATLAAAAR